MISVDRLRAALAAEHAALYAYGRLGVLLDEAGKAEARAAEKPHRDRRDALIVELDRVKADPVAAEVGYALPFPVTDATSAMRLAIHVEDAVAAIWRSAMSTVEGASRRLALDGLTQSAVQATRWRKIAGMSPAIATFPGRPG